MQDLMVQKVVADAEVCLDSLVAAVKAAVDSVVHAVLSVRGYPYG